MKQKQNVRAGGQGLQNVEENVASTLKYCAKCIQPLTRPKLYVKDGVCGGCLWEEEKKKIDWSERRLSLLSLAEQAKREAWRRGTYDCAVGVSGGKDSTFQALYAKEQLGLNCLLVSVVPDLLTDIGRHNFENLVNQGFDCVRIHVNPELLKQLMKRDFLKYCHFRKATEYPLWASVYTVAKEKNIPLIIQGENSALTLGVSEDVNTDWDATQVYRTNTIAGATAIEHYPGINPKYLQLYQFPDLSDWDGKAIWLNYFIKEWSPLHNALFARERGFNTRRHSPNEYGSTQPWTCVDSPFHSVSQMHKYYKYGFGFTTDCVCYDIREGYTTRERGFKIVERYDGKCARWLVKQFCDFIGITEKEHWDTVAKFKRYDPWDRWNGR